MKYLRTDDHISSDYRNAIKGDFFRACMDVQLQVYLHNIQARKFKEEYNVLSNSIYEIRVMFMHWNTPL